MASDWSEHYLEVRKRLEGAAQLAEFRSFGAALTELDLALLAFQNLHQTLKGEAFRLAKAPSVRTMPD